MSARARLACSCPGSWDDSSVVLLSPLTMSLCALRLRHSQLSHPNSGLGFSSIIDSWLALWTALFLISIVRSLCDTDEAALSVPAESNVLNTLNVI